MRRFFDISTILALVFALASCDRSVEPDETFLAGSDIGLKVNGQEIHTYDPLTWQLSYNSTLNEFRAFDDPMKNWYMVKCDKVPSAVGDKITATITWSTSDQPASLSGTMKVVKAEGDTYWLWRGDKKSQTGVTIRILH